MDDITYKYLEARENHFKVLLNQFRYFIGFKVFVAAGLLILGGLLVFQEQMNIGQFVAAEIMIILIINSVEKVIRVIENLATQIPRGVVDRDDWERFGVAWEPAGNLASAAST